MTLPVYHDDDRQFGRGGDTVRSHDNDDQCVVPGRWGDWLWLNPIGYRNAARNQSTFAPPLLQWGPASAATERADATAASV